MDVSLLQKALIFSVLCSSTAFADPCIVFKGISAKEFDEVIKLVTPATPKEFDHLFDCFQDQSSANEITPLEKKLLAPIESHLAAPGVTTAERVSAYRAIEALEVNLNRIDFGALQKGQKNAVGRIESALNHLQDSEALKEALLKDYESLTLSNRAIVGGGFSKDVTEYYQNTLHITDPKQFFTDANQTGIRENFENRIYKLYFKKPDFKIRPTPLKAGTPDAVFSDQSLKSYFDTHFPELKPKAQKVFISKSVLYNPDFEKILSSRYYSDILNALKAAPKSYSPEKLITVLGKLDALKPTAASARISEETYQAMVRVSKNYYFNQEVREKALARLSTEEATRAKDEIRVLDQAFKGIKNSKEQISPEDFKKSFPDADEENGAAAKNGPNCIPLPQIFPN
jgi:hypothetical protein